MPYVFNTGRSFKDDAIDGLAAAYGRWLRRIPGAAAVASVAAPRPQRVSTIVGGGSGHFPAFAGLVGPGLADAAVERLAMASKADLFEQVFGLGVIIDEDR